MLLQQLNRSDAEKVFVIVLNNSAVTVTQGSVVCFDPTATVVSFGNAVNTAQTSNLALFAGCIDSDTGAGSYNLCQVYGYRASIAANVGAASLSAAGLILGPAANLASAQSNGRTFALGPIVVLDNDVSAAAASGGSPQAGWLKGFIRAL